MRLLTPSLSIKLSEKIGDSFPHEVLQPIISSFQDSAEDQTSFHEFAHGYLVHLQVLNSPKHTAKEVFSVFHKCMTGFVKVCQFPIIDGQWAGPVIDHLCKLFT